MVERIGDFLRGIDTQLALSRSSVPARNPRALAGDTGLHAGVRSMARIHLSVMKDSPKRSLPVMAKKVHGFSNIEEYSDERYGVRDGRHYSRDKRR